MSVYKKSSTIGGAWVKASEVVSGTKAKLVSETVPQPSEFGQQDVAKIRFQGEQGEAKNIRVNKPSINALVDAFGEDSKAWIGNLLTAHTEKMLVGGKRVTALYLIPEGYEIGEDAGGYLVIEKVGAKEEKKAYGTDGIDYPARDESNTPNFGGEIDPADIPF